MKGNFMWFRNLTLEEQIKRVKAEARRREISCPSANVAYMAIAANLGYTETAEFFLKEVIKEKIQKLC